MQKGFHENPGFIDPGFSWNPRLDNVFVSFLLFPCNEISECIMVNHTSNRSIKLLPQPECGTRSGPWTMIFLCLQAVHRNHTPFCQSQNVAYLILVCAIFQKIAALCSPQTSDIACFGKNGGDAFQIFNGNLLARGHIL